jgi:branched-subunit amino acid ABC-type transport system permease component
MASLGAIAALGSVYGLVGAAVTVVAVATRTLHLAVGQVLVAGVLTALVAGSAATGLPWAVAVLLALLVGTALSGALGPLVLERLPTGLTWLLGLVVAAGILDAVLARTVTAASFRPRPLLELTTPGNLEPAVVVAVAVGLPAVAAIDWALRDSRWGRSIRLVGGSPVAAQRAGISPAGVRAATLAVGGAATVMAGLLAAPISFVSTGQGAGFTVRGVAAAALLGRGSPRSAVLGGVLLATAEVTGATLWPAAGGEVLIAVVVAGVLAVRGGEQRRAWGRLW